MEEAETGPLLGLDRDKDGTIDDEPFDSIVGSSVSPEEAEIARWLEERAVPGMQHARALKLAATLVAQDLPPSRLMAFARLRMTDAAALISVLQFKEIDLTQGERLAIATAILRQAEGQADALKASRHERA